MQIQISDVWIKSDFLHTGNGNVCKLKCDKDLYIEHAIVCNSHTRFLMLDFWLTLVISFSPLDDSLAHCSGKCQNPNCELLF